ncbi:hypothetical protein Tco_1443137, partial [Tanacetum coccineum]
MSQPANDEFSQHLSDDEESNHEDASDTGAAPKQQQQVIPQIIAISNIKLLILKKKEYDIWAMEMEHYLEYIDNEVWKVIQNGNSKKRISTRKDGIVRILSPVTAEEIQAVEKERNAKNILLMAIPKEHMRRFHGIDDAKEIWESIRTSSEGLEEGYDRFQQLLSQLEAHGVEVSNEDAQIINVEKERKAKNILLMAIPKEHMRRFHGMDDAKEIWEAIRTRFGGNANSKKMQKALEAHGAEVSTEDEQIISFSDLCPQHGAQNVAFVSQSKSSTNKVKSGFTGAYSTCTPSTSSTNVPEKEVLAGFADE